MWFLYIRDFRSSDKEGDLRNIFCSKTMLFSSMSESWFTMVKTKKTPHFFAHLDKSMFLLKWRVTWNSVMSSYISPNKMSALTEPALMWTLFFVLPYLQCLLDSCLNACYANSFIINWEIRNIEIISFLNSPTTLGRYSKITWQKRVRNTD